MSPKSKTDSKRPDNDLSKTNQAEATPKESFTSAGWDYLKIDEHENTSTVELQNLAKGVHYKESVKWEKGGYEMSAAYNMAIPLGKKQANILETWLKKIASYQEGFGIESPAISLPFHEGLGEHLLPVHIGFSGRSDGEGTIAWDSEFSFGAALRGKFHAGALHDSAKFTADLTHTPIFMAQEGLKDPAGKPKIFSLGRGRHGTHASLSFFKDGKLCSEGLDFTGRTASPAGAVPVRLEYPSGTLAVPMDEEEKETLRWLGDNLTAIVKDAPYISEIAAYPSAKNKYLCVRHVLQVAGAGVLCIIGVIAGGGLTVGTGGITIGAFLLLAALCLGAQSIIIVDEILAHNGFT